MVACIGKVGHDLTKLLAIKEGVFASNKERGGNKILSSGNERNTIPGSNEICLDIHELYGFCTRFFGLRYVCKAAQLVQFCGRRCSDLRRFISSPSKSALYGVQTHSFILNVRHGLILARCDIMES